MKKFGMFVFAIFMSIFFLNGAEAAECKNKINVYIFHRDYCGFCKAAILYFSSIEEEYKDCFELKKYEVGDSDNAELMNKVANYFGDDVSGVPYIVIGEKTFKGYEESMDDSLISTIVSSSNNKDYIDVIEKVQKTPVKKSSPKDTVISVAIITVIIGGFVALLVTSKSK